MLPVPVCGYFFNPNPNPNPNLHRQCHVEAVRYRRDGDWRSTPGTNRLTEASSGRQDTADIH